MDKASSLSTSLNSRSEGVASEQGCLSTGRVRMVVVIRVWGWFQVPRPARPYARLFISCSTAGNENWMGAWEEGHCFQKRFCVSAATLPKPHSQALPKFYLTAVEKDDKIWVEAWERGYLLPSLHHLYQFPSEHYLHRDMLYAAYPLLPSLP